MRAKTISVIATIIFYVFLYWVYFSNIEQIYINEATGWALFGQVITITCTLYGLCYLCYLCVKWVIK